MIKTRLETRLSTSVVMMVAVLVACVAPGHKSVLAAKIPEELIEVTDREVYVEELDVPDKHHHDPSNIIKYNDQYYLWYTQHPEVTNGWEGHIRLATSADGLDWTAQGVAIPVGESGDIDDKAAITSYVVPYDGKYYLFYTAYGSAAELKGISYAVADTPDGPWRKSGKKLLWPSGNKEEWDGVHIDDTNVIFFDNKWFLYYKGRPFGAEPSETKIGVATSDNLLGPYEKYEKSPVFPGHAFTTWVHRGGVAAFGYGTFWSEDGFTFEKTSDWTPRTVGLYCPENFGNGVNNNGVLWGMKVKFPEDRCRYITRMELPVLDLSNLKKTAP